MRVLLDTHCWLWLNQDPTRFSKRTLAMLADPQNERWLSVASIWEIGIKTSIDKLHLPLDVDDYVNTRLTATVTTPLALSATHALRASRLPWHHKDPFDRMIIAQSLIEGIPILTVDATFKRYAVELVDP